MLAFATIAMTPSRISQSYRGLYRSFASIAYCAARMLGKATSTNVPCSFRLLIEKSA